MRRVSPCLDCPKRSQICHAQCVEYNDWAKVRHAKRSGAYAQRQLTMDAEMRLIDSRIAKRRRRAK